MILISEAAEYYCKFHTSPLDGVRAANEKFTLENHPQAKMHSGHIQGKALELFSKMLQPSRILEIGTFTGFSALSLAAGLKKDGILHTLEIREQDAATAAKYFEDAGETRIRLHIGDARHIIPTLREAWDLVFIDADKVGYIDYYELTLPMVRPGGFIIADNVLFHGEVLETELKGKNAIAIDAFNKHVSADGRVEQVMLSVRDGLLLIRKL
ncbi:MAG: O-methyltransferase [Chitinophagaceae bacterium]|nr:MAG: O-methyltransferase [Chitinophagaceae bacterium]